MKIKDHAEKTVTIIFKGRVDSKETSKTLTVYHNDIFYCYNAIAEYCEILELNNDNILQYSNRIVFIDGSKTTITYKIKNSFDCAQLKSHVVEAINKGVIK